jgi:manganese containing catalase
VTATGNLKMDLLHNFFLECGARAGKARVYEMTDDPTARAMVGYLLVPSVCPRNRFLPASRRIQTFAFRAREAEIGRSCLIHDERRVGIRRFTDDCIASSQERRL